MLKAITHFEQVPLAAVIEIMEREIHKKAAALALERANANTETNLSSFGAINEGGQIVKSHSPVDIFRVEPQGVLWLESSGSIDEAKMRIQQLGARMAGEYVLLNHTTGHKLVINIASANAT